MKPTNMCSSPEKYLLFISKLVEILANYEPGLHYDGGVGGNSFLGESEG